MATSFTSLPVELIRHIASWTDDLSTIHALREAGDERITYACHHWSVYRDLLLRRHNGKSPLTIIQHLRRKRCTDADTWLDFARAEQKARNGLFVYHDQDNPLQWFPHMLATHCVPVQRNGVAAHFGLETWLAGMASGEGHVAWASAFCFAYRMSLVFMTERGTGDLNRGRMNFVDDFQYMAEKVGRSERTLLGLALYANTLTLPDMGFLWPEPRSSESSAYPGNTPEIHAIALKALGLMQICIRHAPLYGQRDYLIESLFDIPFSQFMDLPNPFEPGTTAMFNACHLAHMTDPAFLEDGQWVGLVVYTNGTKFVRSTEPFTLSPKQDPTDPDVLLLQGSTSRCGVESDFKLDLRLQVTTGLAVMQSSYAKTEGATRHWQAVLTPFGFVATWKSPPGQWAWLWKRSWSRSGDSH